MRSISVSIVLAGIAPLCGCGGHTESGPPSVRLDDSVCEQCNMIISDERWATATIVEGDRGHEAYLFDDFNCQVNYEVEHASIKIVTRWCHSFVSRAWISTDRAYFLVAPSLRTPMGSMAAAFGSEPEAQTANREFPGDVMTFDAAWAHLGTARALNAEDQSIIEGSSNGP